MYFAGLLTHLTSSFLSLHGPLVSTPASAGPVNALLTP